jgi:hypothetical protein
MQPNKTDQMMPIVPPEGVHEGFTSASYHARSSRKRNPETRNSAYVATKTMAGVSFMERLLRGRGRYLDIFFPSTADGHRCKGCLT